MIFIVGGTGQGKAELARRLWEKRKPGEPVWDGSLDCWQKASDFGCLLNVQALVRQLMEAGQDPEAAAAAILERETAEVVTMDEVGCGIVPAEAGEEQWREACGQVGQLFAARADTVLRMVCGIPVLLKGKEPLL